MGDQVVIGTMVETMREYQGHETGIARETVVIPAGSRGGVVGRSRALGDEWWIVRVDVGGRSHDLPLLASQIMDGAARYRAGRDARAEAVTAVGARALVAVAAVLALAGSARAEDIAPYFQPVPTARPAALAYGPCQEDDAFCRATYDRAALDAALASGDPLGCARAYDEPSCSDAYEMTESGPPGPKPLRDRIVDDPCTLVVRVSPYGVAVLFSPSLGRSLEAMARPAWRAGAYVGQCDARSLAATWDADRVRGAFPW